MSATLGRCAMLAGLSAVLGCGADPSSAGAAAGGNGGVSGSSTTTPVAGTTAIAAGGNAGQPATGGSSSASAGSAGSSSAGGGAAGVGGNPGAGGSSGGTGGSAAGSGGNTGGAGGADPEGWVDIFNGQDLTGWVPLIHKSAFNEDPYKTFRADPVNHMIKITYDDYPDGSFDDRCGLLYYDKPLTNYRVRATYHFLEPQAKNPVAWGKNNSGLMIFGIDPRKVTGDPEFPPLIEIQLLGTPSAGGSTSPNICTPGGITFDKTADCGNNGSGMPAPTAATWVTVEAEVHPNGDTKVYAYPPGQPDRTKAIELVTGAKYQGMSVTGGYLSIQSESQPCEFKDIQLIELP